MLKLLFGIITSSTEQPFNIAPKVITAANKLKIDSTFFIPQIYETYRAFAQNGGIALWFGLMKNDDWG